MKKILYLGLVGALCLSMVGCSNSNAFKVGETEVSKDEVEKVKSVLVATAGYSNADYLADFNKAEDDKEAQEELNNQVVSYMIDNEVVYEQAEKDKISVTDDEVNQKYDQIKGVLDLNANYKKLLDDAGVDEAYLKETIKKDLMVQKYREKFEEDIKVTDKEIEAYYNENKDSFKEESVEAYHILVTTVDENGKAVDDAKKEELKAKADGLLEKVKAGEDFEKLAKENSDDQSTGKKGGYLGYFTREDKNVEFTKVVFGLNKDEVSDVFETPFGYEIVKVTDKKTEQKELDDVEDEIVSKILADKYLEHIATLRDQAEVERY